MGRSGRRVASGHYRQSSGVNAVKYLSKSVQTLLSACVFVGAFALSILLLISLMLGSGSSVREKTGGKSVELMDRYDMYMNNRISSAMEGVLSIEKVYWLSDSDMVAPEPNADGYGTASDPAQMEQFLADAQKVLDGHKTVFRLDTPIAPGTSIHYYQDETIMTVVWKQGMNGGMYTFCEVKIAHPSQLRRFLAGGEYGSEIQLKTTQMAQTVNAVLASSGDFYGYRREGIIVHDGVVRRANPARVDTCFIDSKGDLHFSYAGQMSGKEEAQAFVDANDIRFSVAFGPVLIENGKRVPISDDYYLGQPADPYPRAALCQIDELHYLIVVLSSEGIYRYTSSLHSFASCIEKMGVEKAYALDGGQTATVAFNGRVINKIAQGSQRYISDIIYFATALPEGE